MLTFVAALVFVFALMEDVGYLARTAHVFDSLMGLFGLNGKSVLPFICGFGCNIAGVYGSRVIDSNHQRIATMWPALVVPCISTWGVIGLVTAIFFGPATLWVMLGLAIATIIHMWVTARVFQGRETRKRTWA